MYVDIHSKAEKRNPESRGKRTFVNVSISEASLQIMREPQEHIGSPPWHVEIRHTREYSRVDWHSINRTILLQLTPTDIEVLFKELVRQNLLQLTGVTVNAT